MADAVQRNSSWTHQGAQLFVFLMCVLLSGCGYTFYGKADLPFQTVTVSKIVNKTFEPRLEDKMQLALNNELMRSGFVIDGSSGNRVEGIIHTFALNTLSEKSGVAVEYEVIIKGDFKLVDQFGRSRVLRHQGVFIISFSSTDSLQDVVARKEVATDRALRDFSLEIAASILYDRPEVRNAPSGDKK